MASRGLRLGIHRFETELDRIGDADAALDAHDDSKFASLASLTLFGPDRNPISPQLWTIARVSSEETSGKAAGAGNAIGGQI